MDFYQDQEGRQLQFFAVLILQRDRAVATAEGIHREDGLPNEGVALSSPKEVTVLYGEPKQSQFRTGNFKGTGKVPNRIETIGT